MSEQEITPEMYYKAVEIVGGQTKQLRKFKEETARLRSIIEQQREALEYYADEDNITIVGYADDICEYDSSRKLQALGTKAKAALAATSNKPATSEVTPQEENRRLREALEEIREIYANIEGFIPQTAPEAYQARIIQQMYDVVRKVFDGAAQDCKE